MYKNIQIFIIMRDKGLLYASTSNANDKMNSRFYLHGKYESMKVIESKKKEKDREKVFQST